MIFSNAVTFFDVSNFESIFLDKHLLFSYSSKMKTMSESILVSAAQYTQAKDENPAFDPLGLMIKASYDATANTGNSNVQNIIDTVFVINRSSHDDEYLPVALSSALGINPRLTIYSLIGGNSPQMLVNHFARDIAIGRRRAVLLTGAGAIYSLHRAAKGRTILDRQGNVTLQHFKRK
jgi:hypothetical protein